MKGNITSDYQSGMLTSHFCHVPTFTLHLFSYGAEWCSHYASRNFPSLLDCLMGAAPSTKTPHQKGNRNTHYQSITIASYYIPSYTVSVSPLQCWVMHPICTSNIFSSVLHVGPIPSTTTLVKGMRSSNSLSNLTHSVSPVLWCWVMLPISTSNKSISHPLNLGLIPSTTTSLDKGIRSSHH